MVHHDKSCVNDSTTFATIFIVLYIVHIIVADNWRFNLCYECESKQNLLTVTIEKTRKFVQFVKHFCHCRSFIWALLYACDD